MIDPEPLGHDPVKQDWIIIDFVQGSIALEGEQADEVALVLKGQSQNLRIVEEVNVHSEPGKSLAHDPISTLVPFLELHERHMV